MDQLLLTSNAIIQPLSQFLKQQPIVAIDPLTSTSHEL
jgi:hypothetical protein